MMVNISNIVAVTKYTDYFGFFFPGWWVIGVVVPRADV